MKQLIALCVVARFLLAVLQHSSWDTLPLPLDFWDFSDNCFLVTGVLRSGEKKEKLIQGMASEASDGIETILIDLKPS